MNISRRSFISMAGAAAVAYRIDASAATPPEKLTPHSGVKFSDEARRQMLEAVLAAGITIWLTSSPGVKIGQGFRIPAEWWEIKQGAAALKGGELSINCWDGPSTEIYGLLLEGPTLRHEHPLRLNTNRIFPGDGLLLFPFTLRHE